MKKAQKASEATQLQQIPNVGKAMAGDFHLLGIKEPSDLRDKDPYELYVKLCEKTKQYHDPCVLDTIMSAVYFMKGEGTLPWWDFTEERKKNFKKVEAKVTRFK